MSNWPIPDPVDPISAEFWQVCQDGVLRFQKCTECGHFRHLPRYMCAECGSTDYEWGSVGDSGTLYSWTMHERATHQDIAKRNNVSNQRSRNCEQKHIQVRHSRGKNQVLCE